MYHLRKRTGKGARIADRDRGDEADQYAMSESLEEHSKESVKNSDTSIIADVDNNKVGNEKNSNQAEESVAEEIKPVEEQSESTASKADEPENESKS